MITVGSIYWTLETEEVLTATDGNKARESLDDKPCDGRCLPQMSVSIWGCITLFDEQHPLFLLCLRLLFHPFVAVNAYILIFVNSIPNLGIVTAKNQIIIASFAYT